MMEFATTDSVWKCSICVATDRFGLCTRNAYCTCENKSLAGSVLAETLRIVILNRWVRTSTGAAAAAVVEARGSEPTLGWGMERAACGATS